MSGKWSEPLALLASWGRYSSGVLLILAVGLKHYAAEYNTTEFFSVHNAVVYSTLLVFELLLGLALLTRAIGGWEAVAGLLTFAVFSALNLWHAVSGKYTCSCLGTLSVNPWIMFAIDLTVTACLGVYLWQRPPGRVIRLRAIAGILLMVIGWIGAERVVGGKETILAAASGQIVYPARASIDLGSHPRRTEVQATVPIRNRSNQPIRVVGIARARNVFAGENFIGTIEPGQTLAVPISFVVFGNPGRAVQKVMLYCEDGVRFLTVPFTLTWVVADS